MGHTTTSVANPCKNTCANGGVKAKTIITIREPYSWWRLLYTYGYICKAAATCTKDTFHTFMRKIKNGQVNNRGSRVCQSNFIHSKCGTPCRADYFLHMETLGTDWLNLLRSLQLPLVGLPRSNPTSDYAPPTVFTQVSSTPHSQSKGSTASDFWTSRSFIVHSHSWPLELPMCDTPDPDLCVRRKWWTSSTASIQRCSASLGTRNERMFHLSLSETSSGMWHDLDC